MPSLSHGFHRAPLFLGAAALLAAAWVSSACAPPGGAGPEASAQETATGENAEADAIAVQVAPVERASMAQIYSTSAHLRADANAKIISRARGVIRSLLVEEGAHVEAGELVAILEDAEQQIELERATVIRELKQRAFGRVDGLRADGMVSDNDYDNSVRELKEAEHAFSLALLAVQRTKITAPFAGTILERYLDVGATVADGTEIFNLADLEPLFADVRVPERHVVRLAPGQSARLRVGEEDEIVPALIERVGPAVDPATGTVKVTLSVSRGEHAAEAGPAVELRPGAFVRVDIITDTHPDTIAVTRSALVAEGNRWYLFVLDAGGERVSRREVRLGYEEEDLVEVLEVVRGESLAEGDRVVSLGASALSDGSAVKVLPPAGASAAEDMTGPVK
ncbi:MAG: efflux RND transporter periplasmic adaptor subunit [Planctomycetota bacterium]